MAKVVADITHFLTKYCFLVKWGSSYMTQNTMLINMYWKKDRKLCYKLFKKYWESYVERPQNKSYYLKEWKRKIQA